MSPMFSLSTLCVAALLLPLVAGHYGPPPCPPDEKPFEAIGLHGTACAAPCETFHDCPTDVPKNATAKPTCTSGVCVLECGSLTGGTCPPGAKCADLGAGVGLCLYPDPSPPPTSPPPLAGLASPGATASAATPTDPKAYARLVGEAFFAEALQPGGEGIVKWGYGGALLFDGLMDAAETFGFEDEWMPRIDAYLDAYLQKGAPTPGYNLSRNISMPWDNAVGDHIGLFPITYLHRAVRRKDFGGRDFRVARLTADRYILGWPKRLRDGTFSRTRVDNWVQEHSSPGGARSQFT
jgi:hypothetical protein